MYERRGMPRRSCFGQYLWLSLLAIFVIAVWRGRRLRGLRELPLQLVDQVLLGVH